MVLGLLLTSLLALGTAQAYELRILFPPDHVWARQVIGTHVITEEGGLSSKIFMKFDVNASLLDHQGTLTMRFKPWEFISQPPVKDVFVAICDYGDGIGWNWDDAFEDPCDNPYNITITKDNHSRSYIPEGTIYTLDYTDYEIAFTPESIDRWESYVIYVSYSTENFVLKQGDYSVARFNLLNMNEKDFEIRNSIILPTQDDIPRFIPDASKIDRLPYREDGQVYYRWAFVFDGAEERNLWYWNEADIQARERHQQLWYILLGLIFSLPLTVFVVIVERYFFDWSPLGNRFMRWAIFISKSNKVIGNHNSETYHNPRCTRVDDIQEKNRVVFRNRKLAEKENYKACRLCVK